MIPAAADSRIKAVLMAIMTRNDHRHYLKDSEARLQHAHECMSMMSLMPARLI